MLRGIAMKYLFTFLTFTLFLACGTDQAETPDRNNKKPLPVAPQTEPQPSEDAVVNKYQPVVDQNQGDTTESHEEESTTAEANDPDVENPAANEDNQIETVTILCESIDYQQKSCTLMDREIISVNINKQLSSKICIKNQNWFSKINEIVVTDGCRAEFQVRVKILSNTQ